jgi:hypothetical protein
MVYSITPEFTRRWSNLLVAFDGIRDFATECYVTPSSVYRWMNGHHVNARVILTVRKIAESRGLESPLDLGTIEQY